MGTKTALFFAGIAVAGILAYAAVLRERDAPYIAYADGQRAAALDGLRRKAEAGDGFAAFLIGNAYRSGLVGQSDIEGAARWYISAARLGEIRAVSAFIQTINLPASGHSACDTIMMLLDLTARAGDLGAMVTLAQYYEGGTCVKRDPARAADYYIGAQRIDRRLEAMATYSLAQLDATERSKQRPRPERFDVTADEALARFLAEAPALLAQAHR